MPTRQQQQRPQPPTSAVLVIEQGKNPIDQVSKTLDLRMDQLTSFYNGDAAMADRMKWVTLHALAHPKLMDKLMQADLATVIEAIRESASLGLMPIPSTAEGYLVPRWNSDKNLFDFTFMAGYRGYVKLMYQNPRVAAIKSHVVYEGDEFDYELSEGFVRHKPTLSERGQVIATWGKGVILTEGHTENIVVVYDEAQIAKVMRSSSSRDRQGKLVGPWVDWPDPMRQKTVIREMRKTMPMSYAAEEAFRMEAETDERYRSNAPALPGGRGQRLLSEAQRRLPSSVDSGDVGEPETPTGAAPGASGPSGGTEVDPGPFSPEEQEKIDRAMDEARPAKA